MVEWWSVNHGDNIGQNTRQSVSRQHNSGYFCTIISIQTRKKNIFTNLHWNLTSFFLKWTQPSYSEILFQFRTFKRKLYCEWRHGNLSPTHSSSEQPKCHFSTKIKYLWHLDVETAPRPCPYIDTYFVRGVTVSVLYLYLGVWSDVQSPARDWQHQPSPLHDGHPQPSHQHRHQHPHHSPGSDQQFHGR